MQKLVTQLNLGELTIAYGMSKSPPSIQRPLELTHSMTGSRNEPGVIPDHLYRPTRQTRRNSGQDPTAREGQGRELRGEYTAD